MVVVFPAPFGPRKPVDRPFRDTEIEISDGGEIPVGLDHVSKLKNRLVHLDNSTGNYRGQVSQKEQDKKNTATDKCLSGTEPEISPEYM
jgi:hypothetical protein